MSTENITFGDKLRLLRQRLNKSQTQVASEIEVLFPNEIRISQTTLSSLEQRETAPREDVLEVLCRYYNVSITYFFDHVDNTRSADVKSYIEALRFHTPENTQRFAHIRGNRFENDEVSQDLDKLDADAGMDTD